jgi:hypothetical protein
VLSASIEVFSHPLVTPDVVEQARKVLAEFAASPSGELS